ncbi:MAG: alpha-ketoglutarate-dependent dioxygenase AlkB [Amaricoccus sp.]|uniref:alpha-ketoglutarate-dependent dioxygenase AlkB family protein n=1 Tax=Amaricoccus sp. TaxID=1872485 RepID=UPI0039E49F58
MAAEAGGFRILHGYLGIPAQEAMRDAIREVARAAPFFHPMTPWGKPMRVRMTSAGRYGWYSDRKGYRYVRQHPSGVAWPAIPEAVLDVWRALASGERMPDCCLVNFYDAGARMGLHRDADEADFGWPVLSISLGDPGLFRMGGPERSDPTRSVWLESGDVVVMGGAARLAYHGIDRIRAGGSRLLADGGRINLTLRVVD